MPTPAPQQNLKIAFAFDCICDFLHEVNQWLDENETISTENIYLVDFQKRVWARLDHKATHGERISYLLEKERKEKYKKKMKSLQSKNEYGE